MDKSKLRRFLFMQDKQNGMPNSGKSIPSNKSTPIGMSSGLSNPMGMHPGLSKPPGIKESLPNPTAAPSIIGKEPKLPKMARFAKVRNYFKK